MTRNPSSLATTLGGTLIGHQPEVSNCKAPHASSSPPKSSDGGPVPEEWKRKGEVAGFAGYDGALRRHPFEHNPVGGNRESSPSWNTADACPVDAEYDHGASSDSRGNGQGIFSATPPGGDGDFTAGWDIDETDYQRMTGAPPVSASTFCCAQGCRHYEVFITADDISDPSKRWKAIHRVCLRFHDSEGELGISEMGMYVCSAFSPKWWSLSAWQHYFALRRRLQQLQDKEQKGKLREGDLFRRVKRAIRTLTQ